MAGGRIFRSRSASRLSSSSSQWPFHGYVITITGRALLPVLLHPKQHQLNQQHIHAFSHSSPLLGIPILLMPMTSPSSSVHLLFIPVFVCYSPFRRLSSFSSLRLRLHSLSSSGYQADPLCPVQVSRRSMVDHWRLSPNQRGHSNALCDRIPTLAAAAVTVAAAASSASASAVGCATVADVYMMMTLLQLPQ